MLGELETSSFITALVALQVTLVLYIWGFIQKARSPGKAGEAPLRFSFPVLLIAWLALTVSLVVRALHTGHVPFTDMYEFTASFCWGVILAALLFQWRLKAEALGAAGTVIAFILLVYAFTLPDAHVPLPQILQGTILLPLHVSCAIIAYGMFALGFASAVFLLVKAKNGTSLLPSVETLDKAGYLAVMVGLPFMTLVIVLGSVWASLAWGRFWAWDPKETASLVTWIIYAGYLVTRGLLRWRNISSAWLLIIGFAAVLVTFLGNLFFTGLHSYAR